MNPLFPLLDLCLANSAMVDIFESVSPGACDALLEWAGRHDLRGKDEQLACERGTYRQVSVKHGRFKAVAYSNIETRRDPTWPDADQMWTWSPVHRHQ